MYIISVIALRKKKKEIAKNQYQLVIGKKNLKKENIAVGASLLLWSPLTCQRTAAPLPDAT